MPTKNRRIAASETDDTNDYSELRSQAEKVGRDVQDLASAAGDIARARLDPITEYVQEEPVKSLLIAAAIGALLALLLRRR